MPSGQQNVGTTPDWSRHVRIVGRPRLVPTDGTKTRLENGPGPDGWSRLRPAHSPVATLHTTALRSLGEGSEARPDASRTLLRPVAGSARRPTRAVKGRVSVLVLLGPER